MPAIVFYLFLFFASHLCASESLPPPLSAWNSIPKKDQIQIQELFKTLFKYESFAYSLYGDKPITFSDSLLNEYSSNQLLEVVSLEDYCQSTIGIFIMEIINIESS